MPFGLDDALIIASLAATAATTASQASKSRRDRKLASETQRYSPWTGLQAGEVSEADPIGNALKFGTTAASIYSNANQAEDTSNLQKAITKYYDQGGPWGLENKLSQGPSVVAPETEESMEALISGNQSYAPRKRRSWID